MNTENTDFLISLQNLIHSRRSELPDKSYTASLFKQGIGKIAQKVGEEAVELILEAKNNNRELFLNEAADLMYHLLVLLSARGCHITDVIKVLEKRHEKAKG